MRTSSRSLLVTGVVTALMLGAFAGPVTAGDNPPGNNGTVKANADTAVSTSNDPHVGCEFQIDMFGLDADTTSATVRFDAIAPSGSGLIRQDTVDVQGTGAGGSLDGYAGSASYSLVGLMGGFTAEPEQGYHVRLTVTTDGSQGSNKKFKVFWVTGCDEEPQPEL